MSAPPSISRRIRTAAIAIAGVALSIVVVRGQGEPGRVTMTLDVPSVTFHEPIVLEVSIRNESRGQLSVDLGYGREGSFSFSLRTPSGGRQAARPQPRDHMPARDESYLVVAPGGQYDQKIFLDDWLTFPETGTYSLSVRFNGSVQSRAGAPVDVPRETAFSVTVRDRDVSVIRAHGQAVLERLQKPRPRFGRVRQADLAAGIELHFRDAAERDEAERELFYLRDPAAIPYLESAVDHLFPTAYSPCIAIARIGGPEARQALERLSQHRVAWVVQHAKAALAMMK